MRIFSARAHLCAKSGDVARHPVSDRQQRRFGSMMRVGVFVSAALITSACASPNYYGSGYYAPGPSANQLGGTLLGAAAGGLIGSTIGSGSGQLAATAAGTLIGAAVGGSIGSQANYSGFNGSGFERGPSRAYHNSLAGTGAGYGYHNRARYYQSGEIPHYTPGGYIYRGDPHSNAYLIGQGTVVPRTIQNNVFSVPAVQYQYPAYREVIWEPVSDVTVYRQGTAPLRQSGCTQVHNPGGRMLTYCPDRFGGWSLRP